MSFAAKLGLNLQTIGYCTNVHPGQDLDTTKHQLSTHATAVRQILQQDVLAVGLWLSRQTATQLLADEHQVAGFRDWLRTHKLVPYTLNGFPFGDFHQAVVKHEVYLPTWADPRRLEYTLDLAQILAGLLVDIPNRTNSNEPTIGTISTLPLGWPSHDDEAMKRRSAAQLLQLVAGLESLEQTTGVRIDVCLEPEPGCVLGDMPAMIEFFDRHLLHGSSAEQQRVLRHLSVCYDVCHSGVMHEDSATNIARLKETGIRIGKVQVSSALEIDFENLSEAARQRAWQQLREFSEPKYLHQTVVYRKGLEPRFYEDLPLALQDPLTKQTGCWTVHFHVPISEPMAGQLGTTQGSILELIRAVADLQWYPTHWEVETYAWNVLPPELQAESLAHGIAQEVAALQSWLQNGT